MSLKDIIASSNLHSISYSGRGMHGKQCLAITTPNSPQHTITELLLISADGLDNLDPDDPDSILEWHQLHRLFIQDVANYNVDQFGKDEIVIYWSSIAP